MSTRPVSQCSRFTVASSNLTAFAQRLSGRKEYPSQVSSRMLCPPHSGRRWPERITPLRSPAIIHVTRMIRTFLPVVYCDSYPRRFHAMNYYLIALIRSRIPDIWGRDDGSTSQHFKHIFHKSLVMRQSVDSLLGRSGGPFRIRAITPCL